MNKNTQNLKDENTILTKIKKVMERAKLPPEICKSPPSQIRKNPKKNPSE